jgi:membrane-bound metal-dependent hydrolase YbcI (DUF457 family)
MNYKQHLIGGMLITLILASIFIYLDKIPFNWNTVAFCLLISFIFALLPDLDIGTSMIRRFFMVVLGLFLIYSFYTGNIGFDIYNIPSIYNIPWISLVGIVCAILLIITQFMHHRGMMHSMLMGVMISGLLYLYFGDWSFPVIAFVNYLSHLALDSKLKII